MLKNLSKLTSISEAPRNYEAISSLDLKPNQVTDKVLHDLELSVSMFFFYSNPYLTQNCIQPVQKETSSAGRITPREKTVELQNCQIVDFFK